MQFLPNGPDIPSDLIAAQEKGEAIFICGAGVSRTVGLPLFRGLVEGIYHELGEDWRLHAAERDGMRSRQYDRVLRSLERRLAAADLPRARGMRGRIRAAVRAKLAPPAEADLANHLALLKLSRDDEDRSRLLTTNFDTLFERAWWDAHHKRIASHAGPAMPQPKVDRFSGVLHLHGRLADDHPELRWDDTPLILTSSEFGEAYLRSGWASRYVYDVVRVCTVVMVGYQADDPPMRYLLEALEADRERYPDLHQVYALAPAQSDQYEQQRALWQAKGVEPILYAPSSESDHSSLYDTLREWWRYADDPTAWRRERLRGIVSEKPADLGEHAIAEAAMLLGHGDGSQLLGELSPDSAWLTELLKRRVFERERACPGSWIASRIDDAEMIRACAGLRRLDDQSRWVIERAIVAPGAKLSAVRRKAWRLILRARAAERQSSFHAAWFNALQRIKAQEVDYEARQLVAEAVKPVIEITKRIQWPGMSESETENDLETINGLVHVDFRSDNYPRAEEEVLAAWPQDLDQEVALFRTLNRTLTEALEEAGDAGFLVGWDRASGDVASVARHPQNAHHMGFYSITRVLADLWARIAEKNPDQARALVVGWAKTSFLLSNRLYVYALASREVFSAHEAAQIVRSLDDRSFWAGGARVEVMRLLTSRWAEFDDDDRGAVEVRICNGVPREMFPADRFDDEGWESFNDGEVFKRLKRVDASGGVLSADSVAKLDLISQRHPQWVAGSGDRSDFQIWHGEVQSGPSGDPELLSGIADDHLVQEAMRLQTEQYFAQSDLWSVFCQADPDRALRGLRARAETGDWDNQAWEGLLWAAHQNGEVQFQQELAAALLKAPNVAVKPFLAAAVAWLQQRREVLWGSNQAGRRRYFMLWDKLADLAYSGDENNNGPEQSEEDLVNASLSAQGGKLAWTLYDSLVASEPKQGCGLDRELVPRFTRVADAKGKPGLLARVFLAQYLAYLDWVDPGWTAEKLLPRFVWTDPDAAALWQARAFGHIGSASLFDSLKPAFLESFARQDLPVKESEGLVGHLLQAALWDRQGEGGYNLKSAETKKALAVARPEVRHHAAGHLWHWAAEAPPAERAERWLTDLGPLFREIWPLDAALREEGSSRNLVMMAFQVDTAFPDAVDAIEDLIVPYELHMLAHSLLLQHEHAALVARYPRAFLRLTNALIDPARYTVPSDLGQLLQQCADADPGCISEPTYVRLRGLSRRAAS